MLSRLMNMWVSGTLVLRLQTSATSAPTTAVLPRISESLSADARILNQTPVWRASHSASLSPVESQQGVDIVLSASLAADSRILNQTPVGIASPMLPPTLLSRLNFSQSNSKPAVAETTLQFTALQAVGVIGVISAALWRAWTMTQELAHQYGLPQQLRTTLIATVTRPKKIKRQSQNNFSFVAPAEITTLISPPAPSVAKESHIRVPNVKHPPKPTTHQVLTALIQNKLRQRHQAVTLRIPEAKREKPVGLVQQTVLARGFSSRSYLSPTGSPMQSATRVTDSPPVLSARPASVKSSPLTRATLSPPVLNQRIATIKKALSVLAELVDSAAIKQSIHAKTHALQILYRLHRYNLAVLKFMLEHPACQTRQYYTMVVPMRFELAHFSSELTALHLKEIVAVLQPLLANFSRQYATLQMSDIQKIMADVNTALQATAFGKSCLQRYVQHVKPMTVTLPLDVAYQHFIKQDLPLLLSLAKTIAVPALLSAEKTQSQLASRDAFTMLLMQCCDAFPPQALKVLSKKKSNQYAIAHVSFLNLIHNVRNIIAHQDSDLSDRLMILVCRRVQQVVTAKAVPRSREEMPLSCVGPFFRRVEPLAWSEQPLKVVAPPVLRV